MANEWANENFKTILFGDNAGTDAQNPQLIGYLSENADPSAVTTFDLTSLGLSAGDHTIKVKATATGYADSDFSNSETYAGQEQLAAPQNVSVSGTTASFDEVENAELYEFFVDGTSIGEYEVPSGYTVTISVSASSSVGALLTIYDGTGESGTELITVARGYSGTVTITSGHIYFSGGGSVLNYTGGVSAGNPATVTGDGTWELLASGGGSN